MRRIVPLAAALVLLLPAGAPAKGMNGVLQVCGASGCRIVDRHAGHDRWALFADLTGGGATGPALPGPFYVLRVLPLDERGRPQPAFPTARFFYAPRGQRIRTSTTVVVDGSWRALETAPPALAAAVRQLRPFPAPILVRVEVDGRPASDPQSYLRLFRLPSPGGPINDPAGPYPLGDARGTSAVFSYWKRVRRHWLPVNPTSRRPSPWGDDSTSLWVARRLPLVKRDGEIVRVPSALAERIRRARSLR